MKRIFAFFAAAVVVFAAAGCDDRKTERDCYVIVANYSDQGFLQTELTVVAHCKRDGETRAFFNLYPSAYRAGAKITPLKEGDKAGDFLLTDVRVNGKSAEYIVEGADENVLSVALDKSYKKGESFSVGLKYVVKLPLCDERLSFGDGWANLGNFFPSLCVFDGENYVVSEFGKTGDPFVSECADFSVSLTVGGEYVVASGFEAQSLDVDGDKTTYRYDAKNVRDVAFAINKKFEVKEKKSADRSIIYCFYDDERSDETIETIEKALGFFSETFGEYPYKTFTVAKTPFDAGGMEYPCLTFVADNLEYDDYIFAAVHETAHQWWYGVVGNDQIKEAYLDESLAEYSTCLFFEKFDEYGVDVGKIIDEKKKACATIEHALKSVYPDFSGKVRRKLSEFTNVYDYVDSVYNKGVLMMKAAEGAVGKRALCNYLKNYYKANKFRIANTEDFLKSMGKAEGVIRAYLDGKVFLPLA